MQHRLQAAFTLLEIMIAVAILAILIGIGYPSYLNYLQDGYISEAETNVSSIVQAQEQFYLQNNTYFFDNSNNNANLTAASGGLWQATGDGGVHFTYTVVPNGGGYTVTYTGKAGTPVAGMSDSENY